jgi:lysophospholipase L1-like esterase
MGVLDAPTGIAPSVAASLYGVSVKNRQSWDAVDAKALRAFRVALANRNNAPCNVLNIGDSITWGYRSGALNPKNTRSGAVLRDTLRARFPNTTPYAGGFGSIDMLDTFSVTFPDANVSTSGGTQTSGGAGYGFNRYSRLLTGSGNSITFSFTGTGFDLFYVQYASANSFTWAVDGGGATTVNAQGTVNNAAKVQIRSLSAAAHTVTVTWVSGTVLINGGMIYNGDEAVGIRSWTMAFPSTRSSDWWVPAANYWWGACIPNILPDLVTIELGPNDFAQASPVTVANFKSNLQSIIAQIKTSSGKIPSFVLLPVWPLNPAAGIDTWPNYVNAMYEIALADSDGAVCVFDLQQRTGSTYGTTHGGILDADLVHPSLLGARYIGEAMAQFVSPR